MTPLCVHRNWKPRSKHENWEDKTEEGHYWVGKDWDLDGGWCVCNTVGSLCWVFVTARLSPERWLETCVVKLFMSEEEPLAVNNHQVTPFVNWDVYNVSVIIAVYSPFPSSIVRASHSPWLPRNWYWNYRVALTWSWLKSCKTPLYGGLARCVMYSILSKVQWTCR